MADYPDDEEAVYVYANDAFGKRRDGEDWVGAPLAGDIDAAWLNTSNRGFTDHEHLDNANGLIHMNGRVYDPAIGRFISADPYVQAPYNLQSLNRYSYVMNNPLSYTDPSGFCPTYNSEDKVCDTNGSGGGGGSWDDFVNWINELYIEAVIGGGSPVITPDFPAIPAIPALEQPAATNPGVMMCKGGSVGAGCGGAPQCKAGASCGSPTATPPVGPTDPVVPAPPSIPGGTPTTDTPAPPSTPDAAHRWNDAISYIRRHLIDATAGLSIGGSLIVGPYGGDLRIGVYGSCCQSPDVAIALTIGRPNEHAPNLSISTSASLGAIAQVELYNVGFDRLRGTGSAINFITPVVSGSASYPGSFEGDPLGYGVGRGLGWGVSATDTMTYGYGVRGALMQLFERLGL